MAKIKVNSAPKVESTQTNGQEQPLTKLTAEQDKLGQAVTWGIYNAVKNDKPYQLSKGAKEAGLNPSLTCIGGACNLYKNLGLDFSGLGSESEGVRESDEGGKVVEYNPTFAKNYAKAGFNLIKNREISSDELSQLIKDGYLHGGDIVQYIDEKGVPEHSNVVYNITKEGGYKVYNANKHSKVATEGSQEDYLYTLNPNAETFKNKKFKVYRVSPEKAKELLDNDKKTGGKISKAVSEATLNDEVSAEADNVRKEIMNMDKNELRSKYGVNYPNELKPEIISKIASDRYARNLKSQSEPSIVSKYTDPQTGGLISPKDAQQIISGAKSKLDIYSKGQDWGTPIETHQIRNRIKNFGENYNKK